MQSKFNNCGTQYVYYAVPKSYKELEKELAEAKETIGKLQIKINKQYAILEDHSIDRKKYMQELVALRTKLKTTEHRLYLVTYEDHMGKA